MKRSFLLLLIVPVVLSACKKEESAQPIDPGYDYFPIKLGTWVEYQVDSIWRDDGFDVHDSVSYRLKQVIAADYTDPEGRPSQRIERFVLNANDEWVIRDVWTATRSASALEITEENVRKLKISFPVREARTWDMNIYNTEDELLVAARDVDEPYVIGNSSFEKTFAVRTTVPANLVRTRDLEEIYAHGVGMIEHHWYFREADSIGPDVPERSVRYSMVMVAHGN